MEKDKKTFVKGLARLIFCIIATLLFGRSIAYCSQYDEFNGLSFQADQTLARSDFAENFTLEMLKQNQQALPAPLANAEPDKFRNAAVPPAGLTLVVFVAVTIVGWLRRRTPSD